MRGIENMKNWYDNSYKHDNEYDNEFDDNVSWYSPLNPEEEWETLDSGCRGEGRFSDGSTTGYNRIYRDRTNCGDKHNGGNPGTGSGFTKKRGIALAVLLLVIAGAAAYKFTKDGGTGKNAISVGSVFDFVFGGGSESVGNDSVFGNYDYDPSDEIPADYPDDYNEYFNNFFTNPQETVTDVRVPVTEDESVASFVVELKKAEGDALTLQELYKKCAPSIVSITGYADGQIGYNWGTGVILSSDGIILTNTHVINECDSCSVILQDGTEYSAELVGADGTSDLAVLKIEAEDLPAAEIGESTELSVGDPVAAIGNPLGDTFTGTLTDGIISAIDRDVSYNGRSMTLLQTNTALNEGNSGGALFNMHGQVIGITNMKMMSTLSSIEGIGFAIPSSTLEGVVNSIVKYGEVRGRPSIGITVGQIPTNIAQHYEMPEGLYVSAVSEGSDAEKQGIKPGDVLTAVDGAEVRTTDDVVEIKNSKNVGDSMKFSIWRDGEELEFTITLVDTNDIYK